MRSPGGGGMAHVWLLHQEAAFGVQNGFMHSPGLDTALMEGLQSKAQAVRKPLRKRPDTLS